MHRLHVLFCLSVALSMVAPTNARADTRRLALVIGNNHGAAGRPALRFAERDALRVEKLFVELGGFAPKDVELLQGQSMEAVRSALGRLKTRVAEVQRLQVDKVVLLFYFSGHSDGKALELAGQRFPFSDLRRLLAETGADVRLVILDSCRSGNLITEKGGTLGPTFDVRLADNVSSTGEAVITSSAASESALESTEIGASYFSHHLISGLRGAADASGDGVVTLAEAYQYAFTRTVRSTADTTVGPQHPGYDYRLSGRGDLALTQVARTSGLLELPAGYERMIVFASGRHELIAEVVADRINRLAMPPGDYRVRAWKSHGAYEAKVKVIRNQPTKLASSAFEPAAQDLAYAKGNEDSLVARADSSDEPVLSAHRFSVGLGALGGASGKGVVLGSFRAGIRLARGWHASLMGASGSGEGFRESQWQAGVGRDWRRGHRWRLAMGIELAGGVALQTVPAADPLWSGIGTTSGRVGVEWAGRATHLGLYANAAFSVLRLDGGLTGIVRPGAWLEASF